MTSRDRDARNSPAIDWPAYFFDEENRLPERLTAAARRRFGDRADAESAYNYALDEISTGDWQRLRNSYRGIGRADGFLAITFSNLLEEYAVKKYGRKRPPKWVKDLGGMWPKIYRMLCLQRLLPETIVDTLSINADRIAEQVRAAIREVRARIPNCGQFVGEVNFETASETSEDQQDRLNPPEAEISRDELRLLTDVLSSVFPAEDSAVAHADESSGEYTSASTAVLLARLGSEIHFEDSDRLILKLIYIEGQSVAQAARTLGIHEQKVRRRHKSLLAALRERFDAHGLEEAVVRVGS